ncbi:MAG TPA: acetate kinase [Gemmatimonadales bacterium]|nr:acetate kinase [Gemmatimonadales bacterium]
MSQRILVINAGSSSLRVALFQKASKEAVLTAMVERIGAGEALLRIERAGAATRTEPLAAKDHTEALTALLGRLEREGVQRDDIVAVGHRVVHGGDKFTEPVVITPAVITEIGRASDLAPLHNPYNLLGIEAAKSAFPSAPHVAVFDTAFHSTLPPVAHLYAIPYQLYRHHRIRRYGFHGTSHGYIRHHLPRVLKRKLPARVVSLHLGNGASACAILNGESVDTTMGLTPLEGLMMGTRSGDIDPAVIGHLVGREEMSVGDALALLNQQSGLRGVSGLSSDVRDLLKAESDGDERAKLALDLYCYRIGKTIGAMAAVMGGVDVVAFTAGVGENAASLRARSLKRLAHLGIRVNPTKNRKLVGGVEGTFHGGRVALAVVHTDEARVIAIATARTAKTTGR